MNRSDVTELHYICPIENLRSILARGILCHARAQKIVHVSIAMAEIQERRSRVVVPGALPLHRYVNLYFNGRNKMMFKVTRTGNPASICVLRIDPMVLDLPGVIVTDQNAASGRARFRPVTSGLEMIDRELVFAQWWNHTDPVEMTRRGSIVCAEVLVPECLDSKYVTGAYVSGERARVEVSEAAPALRVEISASLFFV